MRLTEIGLTSDISIDVLLFTKRRGKPVIDVTDLPLMVENICFRCGQGMENAQFDASFRCVISAHILTERKKVNENVTCQGRGMTSFDPRSKRNASLSFVAFGGIPRNIVIPLCRRGPSGLQEGGDIRPPAPGWANSRRRRRADR